MSELVDLLARLVAIDSVNPTLVPGAAGEAAIAAFVRDWLAARDAEVHWLESTPGRPSVVGRFAGRGGGRSLLLDGHLDTVGVEGMAEPFSARVANGRLYGRGAYDMKGGVAAMLVAAARAAASGLEGDVLVACVADEEVASLGTAEVAERFRADGAIVTEPTGLDLVVAHKGFVWAEIDLAGRAAHGSRPDLGIDAIAHAGRVLAGIERLGEELAGGASHPLLGTASVHASTIEGGDGWSLYPARCRLRVEWRTLPGEGPADVEAKLRELLAGLAAADPRFAANLRMDLAREPHEVDPGHALAATVRAAAAAATGREPATTGVAYWADAALLGAAGIPTVMFGPGGAGAHEAEEWAELESVEACAAALEEAIRAWCSRDRSHLH